MEYTIEDHTKAIGKGRAAERDYLVATLPALIGVNHYLARGLMEDAINADVLGVGEMVKIRDEHSRLVSLARMARYEAGKAKAV